MSADDNRPATVGVIPKDIITKVLLIGYRAPDVRTVVFGAYCVTYSVYSLFVVSNFLFFLFYDDFVALNFIATIVVCAICIAVSFKRHGMDKAYDMKEFNNQRFWVTILWGPVFVLIAYVGFYWLFLADMPHMQFNTYLVMVLFNALFASGLMTVFAHAVITLYKFRLANGRM